MKIHVNIFLSVIFIVIVVLIILSEGNVLTIISRIQADTSEIMKTMNIALQEQYAALEQIEFNIFGGQK